MKNDRCDAFMLGKVTSCISCSDSIIKLKKVERMIAKYENKISGYDLGSFEYQFISDELIKLKAFKMKQVVINE